MAGNDMAGAMVNVGCAYMYNIGTGCDNIRYKKFKFSNSLFTYYVGDTYNRDARAHCTAFCASQILRFNQNWLIITLLPYINRQWKFLIISTRNNAIKFSIIPGLMIK